jgi:hypothetical protein
LRRRKTRHEADPTIQRWLTAAATVDVDGTAVWMNQYFVDHPEQVLGQLAMGSSLYGDALVARAADDIAAELGTALSRIVT